MAQRTFGEIPGVAVGATFADREALAAAGVHRPRQAGISGSTAEGADSIVVSGGYEDDRDLGDEIIYTGHGGNDPQTGRQIADQTLTRNNLALARNKAEGLPVRVVRGAHVGSPYAPATGYRYDGLYFVADYWSDVGKSDFVIWRYRLLRDREAEAPPQPPGEKRPQRKPATTQRIVRNSVVGTWVKNLNAYRRQVCGDRLETPAGPYAEAAHIRALGRPHDGPDTPDNVLCLCPNHHVLFDLGAFTIAGDWTLVGLPGSLKLVAGHAVSAVHVAYHREHWGTSITPRA
jgi:putative restriction endonuclease